MKLLSVLRLCTEQREEGVVVESANEKANGVNFNNK